LAVSISRAQAGQWWNGLIALSQRAAFAGSIILFFMRILVAVGAVFDIAHAAFPMERGDLVALMFVAAEA
jgi:hypothetical protein